jgi:hypothetical protein
MVFHVTDLVKTEAVHIQRSLLFLQGSATETPSGLLCLLDRHPEIVRPSLNKARALQESRSGGDEI